MRLDRQELSGLLGLIDEPAPGVDPEELIERATRRRSTVVIRLAAGILLTLVAAGAVYAAPGSPLRAWVERLAGADDPSGEAMRGAEAAGPHVAGIVIPVVSSLQIAFERLPEWGSVTVVSAPVTYVTVETDNGTAIFDSGAERLIIGGDDPSGDYRITIPNDAPRVEVTVAGRSVFLIDDGRVTTLARSVVGDTYTLGFEDLR